MKKILVFGFLLSSLIIAFSGAQATLIYDNGSPSVVPGSEMTSWIQAEDFSLASNQDVTDIRFWAIIANYTDKNGVKHDGTYTGSITWQIYSNNAGQLDTLLASGSVNVPLPNNPYVETDYGPCYQFDFSIDPYPLVEGTYWLGLHNGPLTTTEFSDFYWHFTDSNDTLTSQQYYLPIYPDGPGPWQNSQGCYEHAFQLYDNAPLPGAVWLLGSGLAGLGLWRGRKRIKS
jgi:hypothetical protein